MGANVMALCGAAVFVMAVWGADCGLWTKIIFTITAAIWALLMTASSYHIIKSNITLAKILSSILSGVSEKEGGGYTS